ncbi:MAG: hypothetical protein JWO82_820, partial [Akkermansiaceae bacterium]|nr:hypothetical protein [Akkermansiaceae bacterium]
GSSGVTVIHELQVFGSPSSSSPPSYSTLAETNHLSGDDALPEADPNHNGISNLLEYALGGNPVDPAAAVAILPAFQVTSGESGFSFTRYRDRTDIDLSVEASLDLIAWTEIARSTRGGAFTTSTAGISVIESGSGNGVPVQVKIAAVPAASSRFLRLKVIP